MLNLDDRVYNKNYFGKCVCVYKCVNIYMYIYLFLSIYFYYGVIGIDERYRGRDRDSFILYFIN